MARKLNITLRGAIFEVEPVKLERKKLYGWVETRVSTSEGEICSFASLDDEYCLLLHLTNLELKQI